MLQGACYPVVNCKNQYCHPSHEYSLFVFVSSGGTGMFWHLMTTEVICTAVITTVAQECEWWV